MKCYAEEIGVWNDTSAEHANSLFIDVRVAKADSVKKSVERYLILACFEEQVRTLQALVNVNVEPKRNVDGQDDGCERATREWSLY